VDVRVQYDCYTYMVVESIRTRHCLKSTKVLLPLPPSTFNDTTMIVNTFLCHTVAPDEIWALVGNEGKWQ